MSDKREGREPRRSARGSGLWKSRRSVSRRIVFWGLGGLLVLVLVLPFIIRRSTAFYTDGVALRTPETPARKSIRKVLWEEPVRLGEAINSLETDEYEPAISPFSDELIFTRGRPGENADLWRSERRRGVWSEPEPLEGINTEADELGAAFRHDAKQLYFYSNREGGEGGYDIWVSDRTAQGWAEPVCLGPEVNTSWNEMSPAPSASGTALWFTSDRRAGASQPSRWSATIRARLSAVDYNMFVAERIEEGPVEAARRPAFHAARPLVELNQSVWAEGAAGVSPARDFLYFASNRPGSDGSFDLFRTRISDGIPQETESLGPLVNTGDHELDPALGSGGFELWFARESGGQEDIWYAHSREVYVESEAGEPYWSLAAILDFLRDLLGRIPPEWIAFLLFALLCLLVWLLMRKFRVTLSMLARCFLVALLLHALMALWMHRHDVQRLLLEAMDAEEEYVAFEVSVDGVPEESVGAAIRSALSESSSDESPKFEVSRASVRPAESPPTVELQSLRAPLSPTELARDAIRPLAARLPELALANPTPRASGEPMPERPDAAPLERQLDASDAESGVPAPRLEDRAAVPASDEDLAADAASGEPTIEVASQRAAPAGSPHDARRDTEIEALSGLAAAPAPSLAPDSIRSPTRPRPELERDSVVTAMLPPDGVARVRPATSTESSTAEDDARRIVRQIEDRRVEGVSATDEEPSSDSSIERLAMSARARPESRAESVRPLSKLPRPRGRLAGRQKAATEPTSSNVGSVGGLRERLRRATSQPLVGGAPVPPPVAVAAKAAAAGAEASGGSTFRPRIYRLREKGQRQTILEEGGGSQETERAVEAGLLWLARHQSPDGRWSLDRYAEHLDEVNPRDLFHTDWNGRGRRRSIGRDYKGSNGDTAATGLALLAFLGHGDSHLEEGPYRETIRRGLEWMVRRQKRNGDLRGGGNLYMHGIAAFALCEAYAFTRDPALEVPAQRALDFTVSAQSPTLGGWRYEPWRQDNDADTSVFGWMLMALKSGRLGELEIDARCLDLARRYLGSARMGAGQFRYQPRSGRTSIAMTAQGFFCQQMLLGEQEEGAWRNRRQHTTRFLMERLPRAADMEGCNFYYWYYATLALFQQGGEPWRVWNERLQAVLLSTQAGAETGSAAGSWDPRGRRASSGGRVYSTALSILCLEVYYRYAPLGER